MFLKILNSTNNAILESKFLLHLLHKFHHNFPFQLFLLDEVSKKCCKVIDTASIIYNICGSDQNKTENNKILFKKSQESMQKISSFFHQLNSNKKIYNNLISIKYNEKYDFLTADEKEFLNTMINDYESKYGINNNNNNTKNFLESIEDLQNEYEQNIQQNYINIEISRQEFLNLQLTENFIQNNVRQLKISDKHFKVKIHHKYILYLLSKTSNVSLKKYLIENHFSANEMNKVVLAKLVKNRFLYARSLKYKNFSEFTVMNNSFLKDYLSIQELKKKLLSKAIDLKNEIKIKSIDQMIEKQIRMTTTKSNIDLPSFSLQQIIDFLEIFSKSFLFFEIKHEFTSFSEDFPAEDFLKLDIIMNEKEIGIIFIPMLKCLYNQTMIFQSNSAFSWSNHSIRNKPILFLNLDCLKKNDKNEFLLKFENIKTFFHELGHCLHNIFNFHEFQFISNNLKLDEGESMAVFFEELLSYLFLEQQGFKDDQSKYKELNHINLLQEIYWALLDLELHGDFVRGKDEREIMNWIEKISQELFSCVFGFESKISMNYWFCNNSHLCSYPSLFYAYPLAHLTANKMLLSVKKNKNEEIKQICKKILTNDRRESSQFILNI